MQILKKISVKTCAASPKMELVEVDGKQVPRAAGPQSLLRVIGAANGTKRGQSDFGPWVAFLGAFEATNVETGEVFRSSVCLLPEAISGMLAVAIEGNTRNESEANTVEFALDVGCKPCATPTGYEYTIKTLIESSGSDPLQMLKKRVALALGMSAPTETQVAEAIAEPEAAPAESAEKPAKAKSK